MNLSKSAEEIFLNKLKMDFKNLVIRLLSAQLHTGQLV